MLRPIPARILRSTATVQVCNGADTYQNQTFTTYTVRRVHIQPTDEIIKTIANTDHRLRATLYVDARISAPKLDWVALLEGAHSLSGDVRVTAHGITYTVASVDTLYDDTDRLHHWEIGLY